MEHQDKYMYCKYGKVGDLPMKTRTILDRHFNPLVFWYQWDYLLTS